jgi:TPR repeat protein
MDSALYWYERLARRGDRNQQLFLGDVYRYGKFGRAIDLSKAKEFYYMAVRGSGDLLAKIALGSLVRHNSRLYSVEEKREWFRLAAESNNDHAMLQLGYVYWTGLLGFNDYSTGLHYYRNAAAAGNLEAINRVALAYETGRGVERDTGRALLLFAQAARRGFPAAYYNLGHAFEQGDGVVPDVTIAIAFYRHAYTKYHFKYAEQALHRLRALHSEPIYFDIELWLEGMKSLM